MRNQSLAILPAHGDPDITDLAAVCSDLGYRPIQTSTASIATVAVGTPLLLVLAGRLNPTLEAQLRQAHAHDATPILATLLGTAASWDQPLAEFCCDCVRWPCEPGELGFRLARLCRSLPETAEQELDPTLRGLLANLNLIGRSQSFTRTMGALGHMLDCAAPVLIEGETGTGKELVARALHYLGPRASGPFVPVNCGALPDQLLENELFGHERGAYTDAKSSSIGAIGAAAGGTLFLDEIEALSPKAQAALLRFLQDREYRPLGGQRSLQSDARVIAASNADLRALSAGPDFRSDLYFRLDVLSLRLPPLRERHGDVALLANHFLTQYCTEYACGPKSLAPGAIEALEVYHWPGNIRELENLIHRAVLLTDGPAISPNPIGPSPIDSDSGARASNQPVASATQESFATAKARAIDAFERGYLTTLLRNTGGNVSEAARRAEKERRALGKLLKKHAIVLDHHRH